MTRSDAHELIALRANLNYAGRQNLKESELERLAGTGRNPLDILIHLENFRLLWY